MKEHRLVKRGQIYYADLNPVVGSEQGGIRPVLILQNNTGNRYSPTIIVSSITCNTDKQALPTHVSVALSNGSMPRKSMVLLEQIRTIDQMRLKAYIGCMASMREVDAALAISIGLSAS